MRVGGTFAQPTVSIDAETLLRGGVERTLQNLITGATRPAEPAEGVAAEGEAEGETPTEETPEGTALRLLEGFLGGQRQEEEEKEDEQN